jgi:hypothetical protein
MSDQLVRLFHGTSVAAARRIIVEGLSPADPVATVKPLALRYDVPDLIWRDELFEYAQRRTVWRDVSFSTGWGDAASYARRAGGEAVWYALCAISRHLSGVEHDTPETIAWVHAQPAGTPAVITIAAPLDEVLAKVPSAVEPPSERSLWPGPGSIEQLLDIAGEVLLSAPVPAEWVVNVEQLGPCRCRGVLRRLDRCDICPSRLA